MYDPLRTSSLRPLTQLALALALLSGATLASAQAAPPARPVAPAPAPGAASNAAPPQAPAPGANPAPPVSAAQPGVYPGQVPAPQQPTYAPQPQNGYVPPATYPQQQPGVYQQPGAYAQPQPGAYQTQPGAAYQAQSGAAYQTQGTYGQPYTSPHGGTWRPPVRPRRGMLIAGAAILGGSYLLGSGIGASILDGGDDDDDWVGGNRCRSCRDVGRWLFVPVIGPFIAMSQTNSGDGALWTLGVVQLAGLGLLTAGIIVYRNNKRELAAQGLGWDLEHGRRLSLDVQSGRGEVGPRMRIDF